MPDDDDVDIEALGRDAIPRDDVDWGSPRQVEAENKFFKAVSRRITPSQFEALSEYSMRTNIVESVSEALRLIKKNLN